MKFKKISETAFRKYYNIRLLVFSGICLWFAFSTEDSAAPSIGAFPIQTVETTTLIDYDEPAVVTSAVTTKAAKPTPAVKTGMTVPNSLQNAPPHVRAFIKRWLPTAADMAERYDVPISSQLAQSAKETGWGLQGTLVNTAHNFFGIKCKDKTHNHSKCVKHAGANWVKYNTAWESWKHHAIFLQGDRYKHCLTKKSVAAYNICIAQAGYCYPPDGYGEDINTIIATYGLDAFDGLTKHEAAAVAKKIK